MGQADVIDYKIIGDDMQSVVIKFDSNETVMAEAGAMMYMTENIQMSTGVKEALMALEMAV